MENLTHTLAGVALSQVGFNRKTRYATLAMAIGANLPDVDLVTRFAGSTVFLKYHRGITHSFLGVSVLAALLAGTFFLLGRRAQPAKNSPPLDGRWLLAGCWLATASHLLLDFTNSYGVRPFLPFSGKWYAWDIVFIVDPVLLGLMGAGLGLPMVLRIVSEEVGAGKPSLRRGAVFSLCSMLAFWGLRDVAHRRVLSLLDSHVYGQENPLRLGAFPSPANPFAWTGVVETDSTFRILEVSALGEGADPEPERTYHKPEPSTVLDAALKTRTAAVFSDFGRFLWAQVHENEEGYTVILQDLRFVSHDVRRQGFTAEIDLDKSLTARSEWFSIWGRPDNP